jgi:hypothetical protein
MMVYWSDAKSLFAVILMPDFPRSLPLAALGENPKITGAKAKKPGKFKG